MKLKKIAFCIIATAALLLAALSVTQVGAADAEPVLDIGYCNLSFRDRVCIKYAVSSVHTAKTDVIKLLVWTEPSEDYTLGTQAAVLESVGSQTISGKEHLVFDYTELSAKQMTDVIYARACLEKNGEVYYSGVNKYSILQYAYNKMGRTASPSSDEKLIDMLRNMLDYGASAQLYFDYKTDRLATDDFYQIKVIGGNLDDKCESGLYLSGETVTLYAPAKDSEGRKFAYWADGLGFSVSESSEYTVTVSDHNESYTAVYEPIAYSEGLSFTSNGDGSCFVSGIGSCGDKNIVIPKRSPEGDTVTAIGDSAFCDEVGIEGVSFPVTLTEIGEFAFKGCTGISSVVMPRGVNSIGKYAFFGCVGLESVILPTEISSIRSYTFSGCESLEAIVIPEGVTAIGTNAFVNCLSLRSVTLPESLTKITAWAFTHCPRLTSITIPKNVESIGDEAFDNCYRLYEVIDRSALSLTAGSSENGCVALFALTVHTGESLIREADGCVFLTLEDTNYLIDCIGREQKPTLPEDLDGESYVIGEYAFYGNEAVTELVIPGGVIGIRAWAFSYCTSLESVIIPDSVTSVETYAFFGCGELQRIIVDENNTEYKSVENCLIENENGALVTGCKTSVIPNDGSVKSISDAAFFGHKELSAVTIPDGVTKIGGHAFYGCTGLAELTIPDSVTSIGTQAFLGCSGLKKVTVGKGVSKIGQGAFDGCTSLEGVYISDLAAWCSVAFTDHGSNPLYCAHKLYLDGVPVTDLQIPDGVTAVKAYAFVGCSSLGSVKLGNSVTSVGKYAFYGCGGIESAQLSESVESIGAYAFYGCTLLEEVTVPKNVTLINLYAFGNCKKLTAISFADTENWFTSPSASSESVTAADVSDPKKNAENIVKGSSVLKKIVETLDKT